LKEAADLAENTDIKYLVDKTKIQLIEFYRKIRDYSSAQLLIHKMKSELPQDPELLCRFYHRTAAVYNELFDAKNGAFPKRLDTSLVYSNKSLRISRKYHFLDHQYTSYLEISGIYNSTSNYNSPAKAQLYLDSALRTLSSKKDLDYYSLLKTKAHMFLNKKKYDSVIFYTNQVLPYMDSLKYYLHVMESYWLLTNAYYGLNDSLNGLKYRLKEAQADVKFREVQSKNKLEELTTLYKVEAKDKLLAQNQEALLRAKNEKKFYTFIGILLLVIILLIVIYSFITSRKNRQLAKLIKENEFLVGESNHRIKNNLQLIISLIGREIYKSDTAKQELQGISEKINSIAALHQQLYINESKKSISVKDYLKSIESNFKSGLIQEEVQLILEIEDFEMAVDKSVYLGLLVTELIINSLKHGFKTKKGKIIKISTWKASDSVIHFNYQDNGSGLKEGQTPSLVNLLLKQLKASITLNNTIGYSLNIKFNK
jgi:two-component sensor histidine kinase